MPSNERKSAACYQHPTLGAEAWCQISNGRPVQDGLKASLVCRFACPIRNQCPFDDGFDIIARGGWFDAKGSYFEPPEELIDLQHAAAYVGIYQEYLRGLIKARELQTVRGPSNLTYLRIEDVKQLAMTHGPRHGSLARRELHLLRGEPLCDTCTRPVHVSTRR